MSHYVIYARKSSEPQDRQVLSLPAQLHELRSLAGRLGLSVSSVFEESRSAKSPGRPVFEQLMQAVRRGRVSGILCWKTDRLARNPFDQGQVLQALTDGVIESIITPEKTYRAGNGDDLFMGNIELGYAAKFIADLVQNTKRGIRARLRQGWVNHTPRLGYMIEPVTKNIVADPKYFSLVRRMMDLVLTAAYGPDKVRRIATEEWGFLTRPDKRQGGRPLSSSTWYAMLHDPFYMGNIKLKTTGEVLPGKHPPMLTRQEYERIQEIIKSRSRPRQHAHYFTYSGVLTCGDCGAPLVGEQHLRRVQGGVNTHVYYRCHHRQKPECGQPPVAEHLLDEQIYAELRRAAIPQPVLAWVSRRIDALVAKEGDLQAGARQRLDETIAAIARQERVLLNHRLQEHVTEEEFIARKQELAERRVALVRRRSNGSTDERRSRKARQNSPFLHRACRGRVLNRVRGSTPRDSQRDRVELRGHRQDCAILREETALPSLIAHCFGALGCLGGGPSEIVRGFVRVPRDSQPRCG
jgi:DNA invertase Pin-like site-specific DNA recombinase